MTNLYTAEYKGKTKLFRDYDKSPGLSECLDEFFIITKSRLTNITPVKVAPADAIVLDKSDFDKASISTPSDMYNTRTVTFPFEVMEKIGAQLYPLPTPMAEPQGFGAIVEANFLTNPNRENWVRIDETTWRNGRDVYTTWKQLRNPTLISKGVE